MIKKSRPVNNLLLIIALAATASAQSCASANSTEKPSQSTPIAGNPIFIPEFTTVPQTPLPVRAVYQPGELVHYMAQSGDTLPALAARFNTSVEEIQVANPNIPSDATTMPPGMPMNIPIYYRALWGTSFQSLPDSAFVNGPSLVGFNTNAFVASKPGWLMNYRDYPHELGATRSRAELSGAEIVDYVAINYSISPRLLLALLEFQGGALSRLEPPVNKNLLGFKRLYYETPYLQLIQAANTLNNGYYGWRSGKLLEFELPDGSLIRPDPWQNAGSVALQFYFSRIYTGDTYQFAVGPSGIYQSYTSLFGDPWVGTIPVFPGSLHQPELNLPFRPGQVWSYTGGPHTGYGSGEPFAALDFAPPSDRSGCFIPQDTDFVTAMSNGLVVRSVTTGVVLDLDKDGDERTGWVIFYLHLGTRGRAPVGAELQHGEMIGYPSCEGGKATGTHVHIARKYNGEWILADGPLAFNLDGWTAHNGSRVYLGTLTKGGITITACECSDKYSQIRREQ